MDKSRLRESFGERFTDGDAERIIEAANTHVKLDGADGSDHGGDTFRWAFLMAVGWECVGRFSKNHGIVAAPDSMKDWARENVEYLLAHRGSVDTLALLGTAYQTYFDTKEA